MIKTNQGSDFSSSSTRVKSLEFYLPGDPIALDQKCLSAGLQSRILETGQKITFQADVSSTELSLLAAEKAINSAQLKGSEIGLVISAPTLLTSYGFEIPAVNISASLGLDNAETLNISQGCVGFLAAMRIAHQYLQCSLKKASVLIVTACKASTLLNDFTHGAFFWGDAAAAAVVTQDVGRGLYLEGYAEKISNQHIGAMRLRFGDNRQYADCNPESDLKIEVEFPDKRSVANYLEGEKLLCSYVISTLLAQKGLSEEDIDSISLPSIGKNRIPFLLSNYAGLGKKVQTDFTYAHMGGVDTMFFLDRYLSRENKPIETWHLAITPAFTAQWGGILVRHVS